MTVPEPVPLLKPVAGRGVAASVLIGVAAVASIPVAVAARVGVGAIQSFLAGPRDDLTSLRSADRAALITLITFVVAWLVAAIVFISWLWRARTNSERQQPAVRHRHGRGWVIGSWICPIVSLWFPFQIVADVCRASRPNLQPGGIPHEVPMPPVRAWWALLLAYVVLDRATRLIPDTVDGLTMDAVAATVGVLIVIGAAVLLILIIRQVGAWQARWLEATPAYEPKAV